MIVVLDANVLVSDFHMDGKAWLTYAVRPDEWGLRAVTTDAVVAEVVGAFSRQLRAKVGTLEKTTSDLRRFGVTHELGGILAACDQAVVDYSARLPQALHDLGIEVVDVPNVDHMTLVQRAVDRIPPCDAKGDGYRDTLLWFTVLELARTSGTESLVLVGADKDFFVKETSELHRYLTEEFAREAPAASLTRMASMSDVILTLTSTLAGDPDRRLLQLTGELRDAALSHFIRMKVADLRGRHIRPDECDIAGGVVSCVVGEVEVIGDVERCATQIDDGTGVVGFEFEAEVTIGVTPELGGSQPSDRTGSSVGSGRSTEYEVSRRLRFTGDGVLDNYGRPVAGGIHSVAPVESHKRPRSPSNFATVAEALRAVSGDEIFSDAQRQTSLPTGSVEKLLDQMRLQDDSFKKMFDQITLPDDSVKKMLDQMRLQDDSFKKTFDQIRLPDESVNRMVDQMRLQDDSMKKAFGRAALPGDSLKKMLDQMRFPGDSVKRSLDELSRRDREIKKLLGSGTGPEEGAEATSISTSDEMFTDQADGDCDVDPEGSEIQSDDAPSGEAEEYPRGSDV